MFGVTCFRRLALVATFLSCCSVFNGCAMEREPDEDEELKALVLGGPASPAVSHPQGMIILLYGTSSSGKSATMEQVQAMLAGLPGWEFIAMDKIPEKEIDEVEAPSGVEPVVFCTINKIAQRARAGVNVVCDVVLAGETVAATEQTLDLAVDSLREFLVIKVFLGADLSTLMQRVSQRNKFAKEDERRTLSQVLFQIGRVYKLAQPLQLPEGRASRAPALPIYVSPKELHSACHSPMMFGLEGSARPASAPTLAQISFADRVEWSVGSDLGLGGVLPHSASGSQRCRLSLVPRESPHGFRPDVIINTGYCSPRESAALALQTLAERLILTQSDAMAFYSRADIGHTMKDVDLVCLCDRHYARHEYHDKVYARVVVHQIPGLFAHYPCFLRMPCYQKVVHNPSGYYAAHYATQAYRFGGFLAKPECFIAACNDRYLFEHNTLHHGRDIVTNVRRKNMVPIVTLDTLTAQEVTQVLIDTVGPQWVQEHVFVDDDTSDGIALRSLVRDQVFSHGSYAVILFHPQECLSPSGADANILPTWATMVVERAPEGLVFCCIIDPLAKVRFDDATVIKLCEWLQP